MEIFFAEGQNSSSQKFISHHHPSEHIKRIDSGIPCIGSGSNDPALMIYPYRKSLSRMKCPLKVRIVYLKKGPPSHLKVLLRFLLHAMVRIFSKMFIHVNFNKNAGEIFGPHLSSSISMKNKSFS